MTKPLLSLLLLTAAAVALGGGAGVAHAQATTPAFDDAYNKGQDAFNLGKYEDAKAAFEKARDLDPTSPGPYRWLARTSKALKDWPACVANGVKSLSIKLTSKYADQIRADIDACRKELKRPAYDGQIPSGQGGLAVITNVEGASVEVDGIKKGATPLSPFPLNPGKHKVKVARRGYLTKDEDVEVVETIVVDVEVELSADPNAGIDDRINNPQSANDIKIGWILIASNVGAKGTIQIDGKAAQPGPDGSYEETPGPHTVEVTAPGYESWLKVVKVARGQKRTVKVTMKSSAELHAQKRNAYWAFGAAALAGATGAAFGLLENSTYEHAQEVYEIEQSRPMGAMGLPGTPEATMHTRADYDALKSKAQTYGVVSDVSLGVGAVALAVSVYYFVQARVDGKEDLPHTAFVPAITPDGQGAQIVMTGTFGGELGW